MEFLSSTCKRIIGLMNTIATRITPPLSFVRMAYYIATTLVLVIMVQLLLVLTMLIPSFKITMPVALVVILISVVFTLRMVRILMGLSGVLSAATKERVSHGLDKRIKTGGRVSWSRESCPTEVMNLSLYHLRRYEGNTEHEET